MAPFLFSPYAFRTVQYNYGDYRRSNRIIQQKFREQDPEAGTIFPSIKVPWGLIPSDPTVRYFQENE